MRTKTTGSQHSGVWSDGVHSAREWDGGDQRLGQRWEGNGEVMGGPMGLQHMFRCSVL